MPPTGRPKVSIKQVIKQQHLGPETRFHIDYQWWNESGRNLESYLNTRIGQVVEFKQDEQPIDLINSHTGEVRQLSGFEYAVQNYFRQLPDDYTQRASVVDAVFCVLLANANQPMSAQEIAEKIHRHPEVVYKTLGSNQGYQGIYIYNEE